MNPLFNCILVRIQVCFGFFLSGESKQVYLIGLNVSRTSRTLTQCLCCVRFLEFLLPNFPFRNYGYGLIAQFYKDICVVL